MEMAGAFTSLEPVRFCWDVLLKKGLHKEGCDWSAQMTRLCTQTPDWVIRWQPDLFGGK